MEETLGYPRALLGVEKSLQDIADETFQKKQIPRRRVDVVCFSRQLIKPLLLIECKAEVLNQKSFRQVIGYNYYVKAPFIAVASDTAVLMGMYNPGTLSYEFVEGLLPYQDLLKVL